MAMKSTQYAGTLDAGAAAAQLKALALEPDPFVYGEGEVGDLQMQAIRDLFAESRRRVRILDQAAKDQGIAEIRSLDDLVPLLFAHQTYKSYPDRFVRDNKWQLMNRWLDTLSTVRVGDIDVSDVTGVDAWVARLADHGHHVLLSSGTSGKASFLNRNRWDCLLTNDITVKSIRALQSIEEGKQRPVFLLGPKYGTHIFVGLMHRLAEEFGRPEAIYWLSDIQLTEADIQRQAELRRKVEDGSATPGEIQALEDSARERQAQMRESIQALGAALRKHRDEPVLVVGLWVSHFMLMEEARRQGMGDGELHPGSSIFFGGGLKGARLPPDYREQIERFHGLDRSCYFNIYGMTELSSGLPACGHGRYHCPPWVRLMILNKEGDRLLERAADGTVEGRMAFFDIGTEARWGGVITGDKVSVDFSACPCGRHSPTITSVMRYTDLPGGDDKLSCAGTMASYVRGVIEE